MFKIVILLGIVLVCSFIGYVYGEGFKGRFIELSELMRSLIDMENEITYSYRPLPEVLYSIGNKSESAIGNIFIGTSELLGKGSSEDVSTAFTESIHMHRDETAMKKEDFNILLDLAKSLGDTDIIGQGQIFTLAKEKLKSRIDIAEKDYRQSCKVYKYLGVGIGLMIAIFLI